MTLLPLLISACAGYQPAPMASQETIEHVQRPTIGESATASIGDTLVEKATIRSTPGIRLTQLYSTEWARAIGIRGFPMTFENGALLRKVSELNGVPLFVGPATGGMLGADGTQVNTPYGLGVSADGVVRYVVAAGGTIPETPNRRVSFEPRTITSVSADSLKQEFIYGGRSGSVLSFTYREFVNDLARPAFSQSVVYDLKDGNVVGFKTLRLTVLHAGNATIEYRLDQSF